MTESKRALGSDLDKVDSHVIQPEEYDEIPELTDEWFAQAQPHNDGKPVKRGRPPSDSTKKSIKLRLDADVVEHFRETGPGWQTRINETLRRAAGLP